MHLRIEWSDKCTQSVILLNRCCDKSNIMHFSVTVILHADIGLQVFGEQSLKDSVTEDSKMSYLTSLTASSSVMFVCKYLINIFNSDKEVECIKEGMFSNCK